MQKNKYKGGEKMNKKEKMLLLKKITSNDAVLSFALNYIKLDIYV